MRLPSGLQAGAESLPMPAVNRRELALATSVSHSAAVGLFFSIDHSCTLYATRLPSGESAGAPTRLTAHRSCAVIGRLGWSAAAATGASEARASTRTKRLNAVFMADPL